MIRVKATWQFCGLRCVGRMGYSTAEALLACWVERAGDAPTPNTLPDSAASLAAFLPHTTITALAAQVRIQAQTLSLSLSIPHGSVCIRTRSGNEIQLSQGFERADEPRLWCELAMRCAPSLAACAASLSQASPVNMKATARC